MWPIQYNTCYLFFFEKVHFYTYFNKDKSPHCRKGFVLYVEIYNRKMQRSKVYSGSTFA